MERTTPSTSGTPAPCLPTTVFQRLVIFLDPLTSLEEPFVSDSLTCGNLHILSHMLSIFKHSETKDMLGRLQTFQMVQLILNCLIYIYVKTPCPPCPTSMLLVILLAMQIELMGRPHGRSSRKPERCNDFCRWVVLVFIAPREGLVIGGWMRAFAFNESFLLRGFCELAFRRPTLSRLTPTSATLHNNGQSLHCLATCAHYPL